MKIQNLTTARLIYGLVMLWGAISLVVSWARDGATLDLAVFLGLFFFVSLDAALRSHLPVGRFDARESLALSSEKPLSGYKGRYTAGPWWLWIVFTFVAVGLATGSVVLKKSLTLQLFMLWSAAWSASQIALGLIEKKGGNPSDKAD